MIPGSLDLLADRHRRVLRLYHERYRLKEMARLLSLSEHSVNTYLTEAVHILGVPGRRAAAEALARHEGPSQTSIPQVSAAQHAEVFDQQLVPQREPRPSIFDFRIPLRPKDGTPNRLSKYGRVVWMVELLVVLVAGMAIAVAIYTVYIRPMGQLLR